MSIERTYSVLILFLNRQAQNQPKPHLSVGLATHLRHIDVRRIKQEQIVRTPSTNVLDRESGLWGV